MFVSMTPKGETGKVLHCSQDDGENRKFEIQLYDEKSVIDGLIEQLYFPTYKGGTEQLLPSALMNGQVDLGSLTWTYDSTGTRFISNTISNAKPNSANDRIPNIESSIYTPATPANTYGGSMDMIISINTTSQILVKNLSYSSPNDFKQAMQGVILYYESTSSIPTTSNFRGTIEYPNGEVESEFVYRESPTNEDGRAKITEIKGNTIKFNQLLDNSGITFTRAGITYTNNNDGSWTVSGTSTGRSNYQTSTSCSVISTHKYYLRGCAKGGSSDTFHLIPVEYNGSTYVTVGTLDIGDGAIITLADNINRLVVEIVGANAEGQTINKTFYPQLIDLTAMGIDNLTTSAQVEEWLSTHIGKLDYYGYTLGDLISFKGTGLKITGKNIAYLEQGTLNFSTDGSEAPSNTRVRTNYIPVEYGKSYIATSENNGWVIKNGCAYDANFNYIGFGYYPYPSTGTMVISDRNIAYLRFIYGNSSNTNCTPSDYWYQFEQGSVASDYEPYTENTLSLPTLEQFPTGMKSIPNTQVYDRLTESSADKILSDDINLGDLNWEYRGEIGTGIFSADISSLPSYKFNTNVQFICSRYKSDGYVSGVVQMRDKDNGVICLFAGPVGATSRVIYIKDTSYTDVATFKQAMQNVYFIYELENPIITNLKSASLVCKGTELPIYNNEVSLLEDVTNEAGMFDCKVKLQDGDDVAYSEKLSLYVERKPL